MKDTPETDALREDIDNGAAVEAEMTSLARKLERERDELNECCEAFSALAWKLEGERNEARKQVDYYREKLDLTPTSWDV